MRYNTVKKRRMLNEEHRDEAVKEKAFAGRRDSHTAPTLICVPAGGSLPSFPFSFLLHSRASGPNSKGLSSGSTPTEESAIWAIWVASPGNEGMFYFVESGGKKKKNG